MQKVCLFPVGKKVENCEILAILSKLGLRSVTTEEVKLNIDQFWPDVSQPLEDLVCGLHEDGYDVISALVLDINPDRHGSLRYELLELGTDNVYVFGPTDLVVVSV